MENNFVGFIPGIGQMETASDIVEQVKEEKEGKGGFLGTGVKIPFGSIFSKKEQVDLTLPDSLTEESYSGSTTVAVVIVFLVLAMVGGLYLIKKK